MKKVIFRPTSKEVEILVEPPKPAKHYYPEWLKKIPPYINDQLKIDDSGNANPSVKACIPFLDTFVSGYIQETWCDIWIKIKDGKFEYRYANGPEIMEHRSTESQFYPDTGVFCPQEFTWKQPWIPELPEGYSMLYTQPFNRYDLPFLNLTAIIDNDKFTMERITNHPFFIKDNFEGIVPKGTPYMQMIPIKRDEWRSEIKSFDEILSLKVLKIRQYFIGGYKRLFWQKKIYN
jgi:hypothetical protein